MQKRIYTLLIALFLLPLVGISQSEKDKEEAYKKGLLAIRLMDDGKIDESLRILEEAAKLDPKNGDYPYEMAYAYYLKEDYQMAIKLSRKSLKYKNAGKEAYALWGNALDNLNEHKKAVKVYNKAIKKYPNEGLLYLEKGISFERRHDYYEALQIYQKGVATDPMFPSNYYRLTNLFLSSNNKVPGLIYGEIFMNLERGSQRTLNMSEALYKTYKEAVHFEGDTVKKVDLCEIILDMDIFKREMKLPLCMIFGTRFTVAAATIDEINLKNLAEVRANYIDLYFESDYEQYPIVLFEYHKKMIEAGVFGVYSRYILQMGAEEEFEEWLDENEEEYERFIEWYTTPENILLIDKSNAFIFRH